MKPAYHVLLIAALMVASTANGGFFSFFGGDEPPDSPENENLALTTNELEAADALAHYAWGFYLALEEGEDNQKVVDAYLESITRDPQSEFLIREFLEQLAHLEPKDESQLIVERLGPLADAHEDALGLNLVVANAHLHLKHFEKAEMLLLRLFKHSRWNARVVRQLVICYLGQNEIRKAHKWLKRATQRRRLGGDFLIEQCAASFYNSVAQNKNAKLSKSTRRKYQQLAYEHALRAAAAPTVSNYEDAMALVGILLKATLTREAIAVLQKVQSQSLGETESERLLAECYESTGDWTSAADVWRGLTERSPFNAIYRWRSGRALKFTEQFEKALKDYRAAYQLNPRPDIAYEIAGLFLRIDSPREALKYARLASSARLSTYLLQSYIHRRLGEYDYALEVLGRAAKARESGRLRKPLTVDYYLSLATVQMKKSSQDEVIASLESALELAPDNHEANNFLGYYLADNNLQLERAHECIRKALAGSPNNPAYLDSLAWVLYRLERFKEAAEAIRSAIEQQDPGDAIIFDHAGDIFAALGDKDAAVAHWQQAVALGIDDPDKVNAKIAAQKTADN